MLSAGIGCVEPAQYLQAEAIRRQCTQNRANPSLIEQTKFLFNDLCPTQNIGDYILLLKIDILEILPHVPM